MKNHWACFFCPTALVVGHEGWAWAFSFIFNTFNLKCVPYPPLPRNYPLIHLETHVACSVLPSGQSYKIQWLSGTYRRTSSICLYNQTPPSNLDWAMWLRLGLTGLLRNMYYALCRVKLHTITILTDCSKNTRLKINKLLQYISANLTFYLRLLEIDNG